MKSRIRVAEFVFPGHPDKLADAVADSIVREAMRRDRRARVSVEVSLYRNTVFITGRVACPDAESIDLDTMARSVFRSAGYCELFPPAPADVQVQADVHLVPLTEQEIESRGAACDQAVVTGFACSTPGTDFLPVEHAIAARLSRRLGSLHTARPDLDLGPDGKLIVFVEESADGESWRVRDLSVSAQHSASCDRVDLRRAIHGETLAELAAMAGEVPGLRVSDDWSLVVNGAGDFSIGGAFGDNGQTGRKLVIDFYGPRVPIGGGALSGKDFYMVDRAGAILARRLAIAGVQRLGLRECLVTLAIRPGDRAFRIVDVASAGRTIEDVRLRNLCDLSLEASGDAVAADLDSAQAMFGTLHQRVSVPG